MTPWLDDASFEEKSAWITLGGLLLTFGLYVALAARMLSAGVHVVVAYVPLFIGITILLVAVLVAGHVIAAVLRRPEPRDERDRLIAWRAEYGSSWLLGVGVLVAIFALATPVGRVWIAHGLLAALVLAEVLKQSLRLVFYRRGA